MKIYISGPITANENARAMFEQAEQQIIAFGHEPVNPFGNGLPEDATYEEHLSRDIYMLLNCDAIYLLSGWGDSMGARIEAHIASERGMEIIHQPDFGAYSSRM